REPPRIEYIDNSWDQQGLHLKFTNLRSQGQGLRVLATVPILVSCIVHLPLRPL
ncbi:mCG1030846, partial [Mus musculus]